MNKAKKLENLIYQEIRLQAVGRKNTTERKTYVAFALKVVASPTSPLGYFQIACAPDPGKSGAISIRDCHRAKPVRAFSALARLTSACSDRVKLAPTNLCCPVYPPERVSVSFSCFCSCLRAGRKSPPAFWRLSRGALPPRRRSSGPRRPGIDDTRDEAPACVFPGSKTCGRHRIAPHCRTAECPAGKGAAETPVRALASGPPVAPSVPLPSSSAALWASAQNWLVPWRGRPEAIQHRWL